jgi:hypothetical protein
MSFNLRTLTHTVSEISCCFIRCPTGKVAGFGATSCLSGDVTDVHWRLGGTLSGGCSATCFESGRLCDPVGMEQANTAAWAKLACQDPNLGIVCNNNWYPSTDPNTVIPCTGPDYVAANGGTYSYTANGCSFAPYVFLSLLLAVHKFNVSLALTLTPARSARSQVLHKQTRMFKLFRECNRTSGWQQCSVMCSPGSEIQWILSSGANEDLPM